MSALQMILDRQRELQKKHYGVDVTTLSDEERAQYIRDMSLALADELHEALNETGWKPWATSRHVNRQAYLGELIDVLHFWCNLVLITNTNEKELLDMYFAKADKNAKRQLAGYDGVAGKCTTCGRAFDDVAVLCTPIACEHIE
jgi:dimeric dUTPase (all-alpha-NTP-PPase superfamily)